MLPLAEYAHNMSTHSSSNQSLFKLNLGYTTTIALDFVAGQQQHDALQSHKGIMFVECLHASFLDAQG